MSDVAAATGRAEQLGSRVLNCLMEVPGGDRIAQCMDPRGAVFALHSSSG
jgi:predicted enzyme related to lactoylglutathione lyase